MFDMTQKPNCTWSHTSWGRGKRTVETGQGYYVIEHIATGKCIVGNSTNVTKDVDAQIAALMAGTHPNKPLQKLVSMDMDLKLIEYEAMSAKVAKDRVREIKRSMIPSYLLLNP
jgi:hypothetical protein